MNLQQRISAFSKLGFFISAELSDDSHELSALINQAYIQNPWFTPANSKFALKNIAHLLRETNLNEWLSKYPKLEHSLPSKRVGVLMAGNIPLVGFQDFLCVLISGNKLVAKLASDDQVLMKYMAEKLIAIEPSFTDQISFVERLAEVDAVIATGSNNTNRYFEYYFGKYPHIFRKNRNSVAVLNGNESLAEMELLADDIFSYFGLGCRNVSKLFVPQGYDFHHFYPAMDKHIEVIQHNKYANNYHYMRTIYSMKLMPFLDNNFLIIKEDQSLASPVAIVYYENYKNLEEVNIKVQALQNEIQCVVASKNVKLTDKIEKISFGSTQMPGLLDYADKVDTLQFLSNL